MDLGWLRLCRPSRCNTDDFTCNRLASRRDVVDCPNRLVHDVHRSADYACRHLPRPKSVFHPLGEPLQRVRRLARTALSILRLQKIDEVEDLIDALLRQSVEFPDQPVPQDIVHSRLLSLTLTAPPRPFAASIDVHIVGSRVPARVHPQPT